MRARHWAALAAAALALAGCTDGPTPPVPLPTPTSDVPRAPWMAPRVQPTNAEGTEFSGTGPAEMVMPDQGGELWMATVTTEAKERVLLEFWSEGKSYADAAMIFDAPATVSGIINQTTYEASLLHIDATGPWSITVAPASTAPVWDTSTTLTDRGVKVYRLDIPAEAGDLVTGTYLGTGNFTVWTYGGDFPEGIANLIDHGTETTPLLYDAQYVTVTYADDEWEITLQRQ